MMERKQAIVLFGYGKFGRAMYSRLKHDGFGIRVATMLEQNHTDAMDDGVTDVRRFNPKHNDSIRALGIDPGRHLLYCAMDHTANNLFLVLSLRELYHDATIVALSNSEENTRKLRFAGADTVINIYDASVEQMVNALTRPAVREALNTIIYDRNDLKIAEIVIEPASCFDGKRVGEIDFRSKGVVVIAIIDKELGEELIYLSKGVDHKLDAGDTLVVVGRLKELEALKKRCETA